MTQETAEFLIGADGAALLAEAAQLSGDLTRKTLALRARGHSPERVSGAIQILDGRERAARRGFPDAECLFVTPDALAQATSPALARFHAELLAPFETVADPACGLGFDALAIADAGASVLAVERDPARVVFARANAEARDVADRVTFLCGDAEDADFSNCRALFFDPARRSDAGRFSSHAERYEPPLSLLERFPVFVAKLSPALDDEILGELGETTLFLSENRECKEACVLSGIDAFPASGALLLPERVFVPSGDEPPLAYPTGKYLLDPDPALIRAGALAGACETLDAALLSPDDAYLTSDTRPRDARLARAYEIVEEQVYRPKALGQWLRARGVGRLVVKKRRFPKEPDVVCRELGLKGGGDELTLALVSEGKHHRAILCQPIAPNPDQNSISPA